MSLFDVDHLAKAPGVPPAVVTPLDPVPPIPPPVERSISPPPGFVTVPPPRSIVPDVGMFSSTPGGFDTPVPPAGAFHTAPPYRPAMSAGSNRGRVEATTRASISACRSEVPAGPDPIGEAKRSSSVSTSSGSRVADTSEPETRNTTRATYFRVAPSTAPAGRSTPSRSTTSAIRFGRSDQSGITFPYGSRTSFDRVDS